jgi:IS4 transposase
MGSFHYINILDNIDLPKGSYLFMDSAYVDFERMRDLVTNRINFVVRAKTNIKYRVLDSGYPDKDNGILSDHCIRLTGISSNQRYPDCLRRVRYYDVDIQRTFVLLINNFKLKAINIAALYKTHWGIETFYKWIKQHLKIQSFWRQSENTVKAQICIAISSYLIVIIAKKQLNLKYSLYEILQMISLAPFDCTPLKKLFGNAEYQNVKEKGYDQINLF